MFEQVEGLLAEHARLQDELADPALHADAARAKRVNRRYAELSKIKAAHEQWQQLGDDLEAARELAKEDEAFAEEIPALEQGLAEAQEKVRRLLIPRDPDDARDVILEIKGGEGGAESALFGADLLRMYMHYAESKGWKTEILEKDESDLGGYKNVQVAIKSNAGDPSQGVWAHLKYEGGVHRVQRVPVTESQGRIHTSTTGVLVYPEVDEPEEVEINQNDLKTSTVRRGPAASRSTPPTRRCASPTCPRASWSPCRTRSRSCRTATPPCACCAPDCSPSSRRRRPPRRARTARARSAPWTARSASARTTSPRTASRITARATSRTTSTRS
jgi:peptide chain release factor 1